MDVGAHAPIEVGELPSTPVQKLSVGAAMAAGPDQSFALDIVRPFDPVAYAYVDLFALGDKERDLRWQRLAETLAHDGAPARAIETLAARYATADQSPFVLAICAANDGALLCEQRLHGLRVPDHGAYAAPASIVPLLAWAQARPPFVAVVIDRTGADLAASAGGTAPARTWSVIGPDDEIEKNAPGGWSQPRYQHRAEDSWAHNAKRVADEVRAAITEVGAQALVISGDVRAAQLLTDRLSVSSDLLVQHASGSRSQDGSQQGRREQLAQLLREAAHDQIRALLDVFHDQLRPDGHAEQGRSATLGALAAGRVAALLVSDRSDEHVAWFGRTGSEVYADEEAASIAPLPTRPGDFRDVAVRSALLTGARVHVIPAGADGEPADGIGAICRYSPA